MIHWAWLLLIFPFTWGGYFLGVLMCESSHADDKEIGGNDGES